MKRIESITLRVKDLDKMTNFYKDVLNMDILLKNENETVFKNPRLHLVAGADTVSYHNYNGLFHLAILLPSLASLGSFIKHLSNQNVGQIGASDHGFSNAIYLSDPENNGIEVYADTGINESYSKPLNVQKLIYMADLSFNKMPDDAFFGHIHLEVEDIEKGREFYVNKLGLDVMMDWPEALFVSKDGYHHHVAFNVWNKTKGHLPDNYTGLISYTIKLEEVETGTYIDPFGIEVVVSE